MSAIVSNRRQQLFRARTDNGRQLVPGWRRYGLKRQAPGAGCTLSAASRRTGTGLLFAAEWLFPHSGERLQKGGIFPANGAISPAQRCQRGPAHGFPRVSHGFPRVSHKFPTGPPQWPAPCVSPQSPLWCPVPLKIAPGTASKQDPIGSTRSFLSVRLLTSPFNSVA